jgi:amino acid transporter
MVNYNELAVGDPLAFVFDKVGLKWISGVVAISAVIAMASVILVFQLGQPRIWMSMSRDGLLPPAFSKIHPKFRTPSFATIVTGFVVAVPALFMNLTMVTDLCSIGTLFAFVLVCAGVLKMQNSNTPRQGKFKIPYINSRYVMPVLLIIFVVISVMFNRAAVTSFLKNEPVIYSPVKFLGHLDTKQLDELKLIVRAQNEQHEVSTIDLESYLDGMEKAEYSKFITSLPFREKVKAETGLMAFRHKIPLWIFIIIAIGTTFLCIKKQYSLIPVLGFLSCLYMMAETGVTNWMGFSFWLIIGLGIYFGYSYRNSKLRIPNQIRS